MPERRPIPKSRDPRLAAYLAKEQDVALRAEPRDHDLWRSRGRRWRLPRRAVAGRRGGLPCPYLVEYGFYAGNFGGVLKPALGEGR